MLSDEGRTRTSFPSDRRDPTPMGLPVRREAHRGTQRSVVGSRGVTVRAAGIGGGSRRTEWEVRSPDNGEGSRRGESEVRGAGSGGDFGRGGTSGRSILCLYNLTYGNYQDVQSFEAKGVPSITVSVSTPPNIISVLYRTPSVPVPVCVLPSPDPAPLPLRPQPPTLRLRSSNETVGPRVSRGFFL